MMLRCGLLASFIGILLAIPVAASGAVISAGAGPVSIVSGRTAVVVVSVAGVQDLYGLDIQLRYDPSVVEAVDADLNAAGVQVMPGDFLSADFLVRNVVDNAAGTARFAVTQLNPSEPKSGSGVLFAISFEGLAPGRTTPVEIINATLATRDGDAIAVTLSNGEIQVHGAAAIGASATPSPTQVLPTMTPTEVQKSSVESDRPTATRAFTNTPVPTVPSKTPSPQPSVLTAGQTVTRSPVVATPAMQSFGQTPRIQAATSTVPLGVATQTPPALQTAVPQPVEPISTLASNVQSARSPAVAHLIPTSSPTPLRRRTPALVAKQSSGNPGKPILESPSSGQAPGSERPQPVAQVRSGLLIAAGVVFIAAVAMAAIMLRFSLRRRR